MANNSYRYSYSNRKKLKESVIPSSFEIHPGKLHLVSRSGNNYLWLGALPPGLNILSTTLESFWWGLICICSWVALSARFLFALFWGSDGLTFNTLSVLLNPNWQCFCWYNIVKNHVDLPCVKQGFNSLDKRILHSSFLDNPIAMFSFCWEGWGDPLSHTLHLFKDHLCDWIFWPLWGISKKVVQLLPLPLVPSPPLV